MERAIELITFYKYGMKSIEISLLIGHLTLKLIIEVLGKIKEWVRKTLNSLHCIQAGMRCNGRNYEK